MIKKLGERLFMRKFLLTTFLLLVLIVAGCSQSSSQSGQVLKVYSTNKPEEMEAFAEVITEGTGIELEVLTMSSGEAWSRAESEAPNFGADMQIGMLESFALEAVEQDFIEPYETEAWVDVPKIGRAHV